MKRFKLFSLVVRYAGFLKHVPLLPHLFDSILKIWTLISHSELLDWIDELEMEVLAWEQGSINLHHYGGLQFNCRGKEIGHIHSNGLLDILYSRKLKNELFKEGRVMPHHLFESSGWISFYIETYDDIIYAKRLLAIACHTR